MRLLRDQDDVVVIGVDASRGEVPHGLDRGYADRIIKAFADSVDHILPCSDPEILALASAEVGKVVLPPRDVVFTCSDKAALYKALTGVVVVPCHMVGGFVKPRRGSGGKGAYAVAEDHVICETLPGPEYSVDAVCWHGRAVMVVRRRDVVMRGICRRGLVLSDDNPVAETLAMLVRALASLWRLHGPACIQFKTHRDGVPRLTDLNLRFGGGVTISAAAGVNLPRLLVDCLRGAPLPESVEPTPGVYATMLA